MVVNTRVRSTPLHIAQPKPKSRLWVTPEFQIEFARPMPNRWRRFWYWALLGWRWEAM